MPRHGKKRILHVTPFYPPDRGGIATYVKSLVTKLSVYDNEIHIFSTRHLRKDKISFNDIQENIIKQKSFFLPGWPYSTLKSFSVPVDLGLFNLKGLIKKNDYDLIHVHGHHYPLTWISINLGYKYRIPIVMSLHGMYALNPGVKGGKTVIEEIFNVLILKKLISKCTAIIGQTSQIIEYAKKHGASDNQLFMIPNGVNVTSYKNNITNKRIYRLKHSISLDKIVILFVGRFEEVKGVTDLCLGINMLMTRNVPFELVLVGDGSLLSKIKGILNGFSNIKIFDWTSSEIIHEFYIASDIFILPSRFEALPLTILEAMNAHLYIIYTDVGGVNDILENYDAKSMLVESNPQTICDVLTKVIREKMYVSISSKSKDYAATFDWDRIAQKINHLYCEVLENKLYKT